MLDSVNIEKDADTLISCHTDNIDIFYWEMRVTARKLELVALERISYT